MFLRFIQNLKNIDVLQVQKHITTKYKASGLEVGTRKVLAEVMSLLVRGLDNCRLLNMRAEPSPFTKDNPTTVN